MGIGLSEVKVKFSTKNKPRVGSFAPIIFSVEWQSEQTMMACVSRAPFVLNIYGGKYIDLSEIKKQEGCHVN